MLEKASEKQTEAATIEAVVKTENAAIGAGAEGNGSFKTVRDSTGRKHLLLTLTTLLSLRVFASPLSLPPSLLLCLASLPE